MKWVALAAVVAYSAALMAVANLHQVLLTTFPFPGSTAEWDFFYSYVRDANFILAGRPPLDQFRGPLYPLMLAVAKLAAPQFSSFWHAKAISIASAAAALGAVYLVGARALGPAWGLGLLAATAATTTFVLHGFLAGTDMLFAALGLFAVYFLMRAVEDGRWQDAAVAGLVSGVALTLRWNAAVIPAIAVVLFALTGRDRARMLAAYLAPLVAAAAPWWAFNAVHRGSPFHNLNFMNVATGIYGASGNVGSLSEVVLRDPWLFARRWAAHAVEQTWLVGVEAGPLALLAVPGLALLAARARRRPMLLAPLGVGVALLAANSLTPFIARQYLILLPVVLLAAAAAAAAVAARLPRTTAARAAVAAVWIAGASVAGYHATAATASALASERKDWDARWAAFTTSGEPIAGDWDGDGRDDVGIVRIGRNYKVFYMFSSADRPADLVAAYGSTLGVPLAGDWNGDGLATPGLFVNGAFLLNDEPFIGNASHVFSFGESSSEPVVGDWDGDGRDTVAVRTRGDLFLLARIDGPYDAETFATLGIGKGQVLAGDWDGDGRDDPSEYRDGRLVWIASSTGASGQLDTIEPAGSDARGAVALAGDWDGDGRDALALYRDGAFTFYDEGGAAVRTWRVPFDNLTDLPATGE